MKRYTSTINSTMRTMVLLSTIYVLTTVSAATHKLEEKILEDQIVSDPSSSVILQTVKPSRYITRKWGAEEYQISSIPSASTIEVFLDDGSSHQIIILLTEEKMSISLDGDTWSAESSLLHTHDTSDG